MVATKFLLKRALISLLLLVSSVQSQELNCSVTVNYDKITNVNTQIFKSLQQSLNDFINKTAWTEKSFKNNEKIYLLHCFINYSIYLVFLQTWG